MDHQVPGGIGAIRVPDAEGIRPVHTGVRNSNGENRLGKNQRYMDGPQGVRQWQAV